MTGDRLTGTGRLYQRPTLDVVVLILAFVVAFIMATGAVAVTVLELTQPDAQTDEVIALLDGHLGTLIGVLVGLIAGQSVARERERQPFR